MLELRRYKPSKARLLWRSVSQLARRHSYDTMFLGMAAEITCPITAFIRRLRAGTTPTTGSGGYNLGQSCLLLPVHGSALTKSARRWALAGWVKSIARGTQSWGAVWRSKSCPRYSPRTQNEWRASGAKLKFSRR